jgi:hypothetical protein
MADSENEYSDDEIVTSKGRAAASNPKRAHERWEILATNKAHGLADGADGNMEGVLGGIEEANKRRRYVSSISDTLGAIANTHV